MYFIYFQNNTVVIFLSTFSMPNKKVKLTNELKYKHYAQDDGMTKALQAARSRQMSQQVACKVYNVKRASLQHRLQGITANNVCMGGHMVLTC